MSFFESFGMELGIPQKQESGVTFTVEKILKGQSDKVKSVIYFCHPYNKVISCSDDYTIRIWSSLTGESQQSFAYRGCIRDLIKMNETFFISCSSGKDKTIRSYIISSPDFKVEQAKELKMRNPVFGLLKLTEDLFICSCSSDFFILSHANPESSDKEIKIVKRFYAGYLRFNSPPNPFFLSRNYPHCLYISTNDDKYDTIKLVDYENEKVVKQFTGHSTYFSVRSLCLFKNSKNEEVLIACFSSQRIYFYNTSHHRFETNIKLAHIERFWRRKLINREESEIVSSFCLNNQYLVGGGLLDGKIHILEFSEDGASIKRIESPVIHKGGINSLILISPPKGSDELRVISCSDDATIKITRISGVHMKKRKFGYEIQDLKERIHFLVHDMEKVFFKDKRRFVVETRIHGQVFDLPKLLLCGTKE